MIARSYRAEIDVFPRRIVGDDMIRAHTRSMAAFCHGVLSHLRACSAATCLRR